MGPAAGPLDDLEPAVEILQVLLEAVDVALWARRAAMPAEVRGIDAEPAADEGLGRGGMTAAMFRETVDEDDGRGGGPSAAGSGSHICP